MAQATAEVAALSLEQLLQAGTGGGAAEASSESPSEGVWPQMHGTALFASVPCPGEGILQWKSPAQLRGCSNEPFLCLGTRFRTLPAAQVVLCTAWYLCAVQVRPTWRQLDRTVRRVPCRISSVCNSHCLKPATVCSQRGGVSRKLGPLDGDFRRVPRMGTRVTKPLGLIFGPWHGSDDLWWIQDQGFFARSL